MGYNRGYFGFKALPGNLKSESSIYAIADENLGEVDIIPLTIGCFNDLYLRLQQFVPLGSKIRIFPMSINYDYISDIYNAVTTFKRLHKVNNFDVDIMWVFPTNPPYYSEEFDLTHFKGSNHHNEACQEINITMEASGCTGLYDIVITTPEFVKVFTQYATEEKIAKYTELGYEIHMNGNESRHGGLCGIDIPGQKNLRYFNIMNKDSLNYFRAKGLLGYDYERWVGVV